MNRQRARQHHARWTRTSFSSSPGCRWSSQSNNTAPKPSVAGTFAATKLPLRTWFVAIYALTSTKTNVAALELMRQLGVCYRIVWRLQHKIMQAMTEREETRQLAGFVQVADVYLGGERNGGKPGRGSENKQPFLIAVAADEALEHPSFAVIERTVSTTPL